MPAGEELAAGLRAGPAWLAVQAVARISTAARGATKNLRCKRSGMLTLRSNDDAPSSIPVNCGAECNAEVRTRPASGRTRRTARASTRARAEVAGAVERVDEEEHASGHGDGAGDVEAFAPPAVASVDGQEGSRHPDEEDGDRKECVSANRPS